MAQPPENNADSNIKVLSVVWYKVLPPKFGGQKAVAFFNEYLSKEASLDSLCSKNNSVPDVSYKIHPTLPIGKSQFINPFVWRKLYLFAKRNNITHLILEFPYHGIAGFICKKLLKVKLIINTHNIEYLRFREQKRWWWGLLYHFERWTLRNADSVFFKTITDMEVVTKSFALDKRKLCLVPYGVEDPVFFSKKDAISTIRKRYGIPEEEKILLFAGTLDYAPNADAIVAIKEQIIPLLNQSSLQYKIIVCGRNRLRTFNYLNRITHANLILAGEVEDIGLYMKAADVFINPVITGGGIQTKIIDALSHHLNVVCFNSKCSGIAAADSKIYAVKDGSWTDFVSAIMKATRETIVTPAAFFETYNWRTIAGKAYRKISSL